MTLEHDPEKWDPVFPRDEREAFARRSNKVIERDDDLKKSLIPGLVLVGGLLPQTGANEMATLTGKTAVVTGSTSGIRTGVQSGKNMLY